MECFQDESENNKDLPAVCLHKNTVPVKKEKDLYTRMFIPQKAMQKGGRFGPAMEVGCYAPFPQTY